MKGKLRLILALTVCTAFNGTASGTPFGLIDDPATGMWDRNDPNTGFAVFDSFPSFTFSNHTPGSSVGMTSPLLTQTNTVTGSPATDQGAGVWNNALAQTPGNDVWFAGGRGGTFSFTADTAFDVKGVFLQIKLSTHSAATFTPVLMNGATPIPFDESFTVNRQGDSHDNAIGAYTIKSYFWGSSLASVTLPDLTINFTAPNTRGIDAITIDAGPVPEPGTMGLVGLGLFTAALRRRRR